MLDYLFGLFSHEVGIDLGTANTLVSVKGKGIVIREPSYIARHKKTKEILAIGTEAKRMLGKTPASIVVSRPLQDGVISDFEATEAMLRYYISKVVAVHIYHQHRIAVNPKLASFPFAAHIFAGVFIPVPPRDNVLVAIIVNITEAQTCIDRPFGFRMVAPFAA